jgi:polysaccharide chain length determinant protein (PEP-CTERM system associated)
MEPLDFLEIVLRRKWYILFSFLVSLFGAGVYSVAVPEQYKSSTTILIVSQRVPENYIKSTVSEKIEDRLATIRQQVLSRTRLVQVMDELGLFKEMRKKVPVEEAVETMQKRIGIQVDVNNKTPGAFTLSFLHENPRMAMLTVSRLASTFIDENLKSREHQAAGTSEFMEAQLQETRKKLKEQEEKVKRYKMNLMRELPQQVQANLQALSRLQDQLRANADAISAVEDRRILFETQANSFGMGGTQESGALPLDPAGSIASEIAAKKARLAELNTRYTDRYPEIARLKAEVEQLEKRFADARREPSAVPLDNSKPVPAAIGPSQYQREQEELHSLHAQAAACEREAASLKKERAGIMKKIEAVQAKVVMSPRREQEMIALTRDYENLKLSYDGLLKKRLEADISQNLEKRQKGEQFQILDPANLPEEPFIPDRKKVFGIALMAWLALGFGGVIGREALDPALHGETEFKHFYNLSILGAVPSLLDEDNTPRRQIRRAAILGGVVTFTVAVSIFLFVYAEKIRSLLNLSWSR